MVIKNCFFGLKLDEAAIEIRPFFFKNNFCTDLEAELGETTQAFVTCYPHSILII